MTQSEFKNIFVIKQTSLGDVIHGSAYLAALKVKYPHSKITFMIDRESYPALRHTPYVDEWLIYEMKALTEWLKNPLTGWPKIYRHLVGLIKAVRKETFDIAVDIQGRARTVFFLYLCRARFKAIKGQWLFLNSFKDPRNEHALTTLKRMFTKFHGEPETFFPELSLAPSSERHLLDWYKTKGFEREKEFLLVVSPLSRWATKNWREDYYQKLFEKLDRLDQLRVLVTGSKGDASRLKQLCEGRSSKFFVAAGELDFDEFVAVIKDADLLITSDSSPLHVANTFHTPTIVFFGPTNPVLVGPYEFPEAKVLLGKMDCNNCYQRSCSHHSCMKKITPEEVFQEFKLRFDPLRPRSVQAAQRSAL